MRLTIDDDRIKQRALELWQQRGSPEGYESEFWLQAERELNGQTDANSVGGANAAGAKSGGGSDGPG
jgi:Protein of unknown function (DUF2934)